MNPEERRARLKQQLIERDNNLLGRSEGFLYHERSRLCHLRTLQLLGCDELDPSPGLKELVVMFSPEQITAARQRAERELRCLEFTKL